MQIVLSISRRIKLMQFSSRVKKKISTLYLHDRTKPSHALLLHLEYLSGVCGSEKILSAMGIA